MLLLSTVELRGKGGAPHSYPLGLLCSASSFSLFETANGARRDGLAAKSSDCFSIGWVSFSTLPLNSDTQLTTVYNGISRASSALFWPPGVPDLLVMHTCDVQAYKYTRHPFK